MKLKKARVLSLVLNCVLFVSTALCIGSFFWGDGHKGFAMFRYFTILSNVFCALVSACLVPCQIRALKDSSVHLPVKVQLFKYAATVTVTLTFLVVVVFLGPVSGNYFAMFAGENFHLHFMGPVMAIVSFCFFEQDNMLKKMALFIPLLPVLAYGITYFLMVVLTKTWPDFYFFNAGGRWYVSFALVAAATSVICFVEFTLNQRRFRNVRRA